MPTDIFDMTDAELGAEFGRLAELRDAIQWAMEAVRVERAVRRDSEIERLKAEIEKKG